MNPRNAKWSKWYVQRTHLQITQSQSCCPPICTHISKWAIHCLRFSLHKHRGDEDGFRWIFPSAGWCVVAHRLCAKCVGLRSGHIFQSRFGSALCVVGISRRCLNGKVMKRNYIAIDTRNCATNWKAASRRRCKMTSWRLLTTSCASWTDHRRHFLTVSPLTAQSHD